MCLFPLPNLKFNSLAYQKGVTVFDCGSCPECMSKRANYNALTSVYEAREHSHNCMITLTYDTFARDSKGNFLLDKNGNKIENPVDPDLKVNVRDVQLFLKRLRKYISYHYPDNEKIKYRVAAEYGSRTHRAHYHLLIFGFDFPDRHFYKKSGRGNSIYMSPVLSKLWSHGICTVDCVRVHSAVARYCSKYLAKSRSDETFSLSSHGIGLVGLLRDFNGLSYFIDGREYPVPRKVWETYIVNKYQRKYLYLKNAPLLSPKYVNAVYDNDRNFLLNEFEFERSVKQRSFYRKIRDKDNLYVRYLEYWRFKASVYERNKLSVRQRIYLLDDSKYHFYKIKALECLDLRSSRPYPAPGSGCISAYARYLDLHGLQLPAISRLKRAIDTKPYIVKAGSRFHLRRNWFLPQIFDDLPKDFLNFQLTFFD